MYVLSVYVLLVACSDDNSVALSAGVLCGNCRDGYGVSVLLNKCVTCHDASGILIAVLSECMSFRTQILCSLSCVPYVFSSVAADAVVFISLLLLIKTFPTWLYPCLFYIQVTIALVTAGVVSRVKYI